MFTEILTIATALSQSRLLLAKRSNANARFLNLYVTKNKNTDFKYIDLVVSVFFVSGEIPSIELAVFEK